MSSAERAPELLSGILPATSLATFGPQDGVPSRPMAAPATTEQAVEVVRLARAERWSILPLGLGSKLGWARPPRACDLVLSSRNLRGIQTYEPADGTLTARAGTRWSELVTATEARHHLSPELPRAEHATLGGVLGAGASGLDRLRHGPLRHQVLGIQALLADGSVVKSGGRVVKNVTGYDLHRLWCGSHGSLCFLLEASLRLYPAPAEMAVLRTRPASRAAGLALSHALLLAKLRPVAVVLTSAHEHELAVVLAGRSEGLASEVATARELLPAAELSRGDDARRARAALRELELADSRYAPLVLSTRPSGLGAALERLDAAARELALVPRLVCHPLLGSAEVRFSPDGLDEARLGALAPRLSTALAQNGLTLRWRGLGTRAPAPALAAPAAALMQRLEKALDPQGLFARGRFDEGL